MAEKTRAAKTGLGYVVEQKMEQVRGLVSICCQADHCLCRQSLQFVIRLFSVVSLQQAKLFLTK